MSNNKTAHKLVGSDTSKRKREFMNWKGGKYYPSQWVDSQLDKYRISGTDHLVEIDDLHFINNPAMQQMWDDIRRTIIVGLDMTHEVLQKRLDKEITPETINNYLEVLNNAAGGTLVPDYVAEIHPGLISDANVKIFTGDDSLADEIDDQYLIDINKMFPAEQAEALKAAVGKTTWQAFHIPTIIVRSCDGAATAGWSTLQICKTLMDAYNLDADRSILADLAYSAKQAPMLKMSEMLSASRAKGPNNPGSLSFGFLADMVQTSRTNPEDPVKISMNVVTAGAVIYDQIWLGGYMSAGYGFTDIACATYTNNILDELCYYGAEFGRQKFGGFAKAPNNLDSAKYLAAEVTAYGMEQYENIPTLLETHSDGSQRAFVLASASGITSAIMTGNSQLGLCGWYTSQLIHKEAWGRLGGSLGYDLQDQCGHANAFSYQSDEGNPLELRSPNYPSYALDLGHLGGYAGIVSAAHAARFDAFVVNPLIKVTFANPALAFDWADVRECIGKGALRLFRAQGERDLVMP
jgi:methyl-coenzyme M reductase alpha subunit